MLKKTLPSHAVGAWFEPIMPKGMRGNVIKLEVPNAFFCDWIDSHYKKQLMYLLYKLIILIERVDLANKPDKYKKNHDDTTVKNKTVAIGPTIPNNDKAWKAPDI